MSYRYAWGLIKKAEEKLGEPLIEATKGGRKGGGSSEITPLGATFIADFEELTGFITEAATHADRASIGTVNLEVLNVSVSDEKTVLTLRAEGAAEFTSGAVDAVSVGDTLKAKLLLED